VSLNMESDLSVKVALIPEEGIVRDWSVDPERFSIEAHPLPVCEPAAVSGKLYRIGMMIYFDARVGATVKLACSRCLESFSIEVEGETSAVFVEREAAGGDEVKRLADDDQDVFYFDGEQIDLFDPLRDLVALSIPMQPLCKAECKGLCQSCGVNLNRTQCSCEQPGGDPRLAVLKNLITKQED